MSARLPLSVFRIATPLLLLVWGHGWVWANPCTPLGTPREDEALVLGKPYTVPDLHFQFLDLATGEPVIPELVSVFYLWAEIQEGRWDGDSEIFECFPRVMSSPFRRTP